MACMVLIFILLFTLTFHSGTVNKAGDTPLSLACANGHLDTVKFLVNRHRCDPSTFYFFMQKGSLCHATMSWHALVYTGTVNKVGDTPLSLACANGHLDTVKYLVNEHRCDPRSKFIVQNRRVKQLLSTRPTHNYYSYDN